MDPRFPANSSSPPCRAGSFAFGSIVLSLLLTTATSFAQISPLAVTSVAAPAYRQDRILLKPKAATSAAALARFHSSQQGKIRQTFEGIGRLQIVELPKGVSVPAFIAGYQQSGLVEFAEPDYEGHTAVTSSNDPQYLNGSLWALNNTGQSGGTADADIDAPEAWDVLTSASNIVVAVLDTGVRYTHEDLAANMWVNPNDGSHGLNAIAGTTDPSDDSGNGHGTMVAGVLGAVGNNGKGVTGVAWRVQIMACKCFNSLGNGNISDVVTCLDYARTNGAKVINASWGFFPGSLALSNAVSSLRDAGVIVVVASGNSTNNIDVNPVYPAGYPLDNIVTVASTSRQDTLSYFSNYGSTNVHLAAPGEEIKSTHVALDTFYFTESGTSFSAPYVVGAFALMLAKFPGETHQQLISRVLNATHPLPSLAGKCVSGGRLNLRNALNPVVRLTVLPTALNAPFQLRVSASANRTCIIQASTNLINWSPVFTNSTSASGTFDFTDANSPGSEHRFYRVSASL